MPRPQACLPFLALVWLAAAPIAAETTGLLLDSQPGDFVGAGRRYTYAASDGRFRSGADAETVTIDFVSLDGSHWWSLRFAAPVGEALVPGAYEGAVRTPFGSPLRPGLEVVGEDRACNGLSGRFTVLEARLDPSGGLAAFAADFEQHCENAGPALLGSIRVSAAAALAARVSLGGGTVAKAAPSVAAGAPRTLLFLNSQEGDSVGQGLLQVLTPADGRFSLQQTLDGAAQLVFRGDVRWEAHLAAPRGSALGPGVYEAAAAWPFQAAGQPGLVVDGQGVVCDAVAGRFVVLEAVVDPIGGFQRFAANFEQHCEAAAPALYGAVRYSSLAGPSADLAVSLAPPPESATIGRPVDYTFSVTNNGPDPVAKAAVAFTASPSLRRATWSCAALGGARCGAGGSDLRTDVVSLPVRGSVVYSVRGEGRRGDAGLLALEVAVAPPAGVLDWNPANDSAQARVEIRPPRRGGRGRRQS
jgi:hypothetical protein